MARRRTNDAKEPPSEADGSGLTPLATRPVVVGEVLFDVFPDGSRVLGGAPFNVAWHLEAFGLRPLVVTRIGNDELGDELLATMAGWGMDTAGVQVDPDVVTGQVRVTLDGGSPTFEIAPGQAWDRLDADAAVAAASNVDGALLYHGSLMARSGTGRAALRELRCRIAGPVFMDVNLRDPWWSPGGVGSLLSDARWAKLSADEILRLARTRTDAAPADPEAAAADLARTHDLEQVIVTCGEDGAFLWVDGCWLAGRPPLEVEVVDTVGAGDAFSAVWITGLLEGWSTKATLMRALDFSAALCTVRGATTPDRRIHNRHLEIWKRE